MTIFQECISRGQTDESAEIPGEGIIDQGPTVPDLIDDDVNVGIDFDSHKPQDPAELVL